MSIAIIGDVLTPLQRVVPSPSPQAARAAIAAPTAVDSLRHSYPGIVGRGPAILEVLGTIDRLADSDAPVLLAGETGTGKELFARALHDTSARAARPFVAFNCAALPASLFEAELLGYRRGAFTGAVRDHDGLALQAHGGTLFLDEVGELAPDLQPKLLRVLTERLVRPLGSDQAVPVDIRVVSATNRGLREDVERGVFRSDLYYRLAGVEVKLPPLRERRSDLPELICHMLALHGRPGQEIDPRALRRLVRYDWPGNVRELENELTRASLFAGAGPIRERHLSPRLVADGPARRASSPGGGSLPDRVRAFERTELADALRRSNGHRLLAARLLGIAPRTLFKKLNVLGLGGRK
jgi:transcriptional regulator with PAS, ATPase and Fis domain